MTEPVQGLVGNVSVADGQYPVLRLGRNGEQIVGDLHARKYEAAYRRSLFFAYNETKTLSNSATVFTGSVLWNGSSSVNLALTRVGLIVSVTSATMTGILLASTTAGAQTAAPTGTTAATRSGSTFLGQASSAATAYSAGTTQTTTNFLPLLHNTAAINTVGVDWNWFDLEGSIIVPPLTAIAIQSLGAASAASAVTSYIEWEEVGI